MKVTTLKDKYENDYCLYTDKEFFIGKGKPDDAVLSLEKMSNCDVIITDKDQNG